MALTNNERILIFIKIIYILNHTNLCSVNYFIDNYGMIVSLGMTDIVMQYPAVT